MECEVIIHYHLSCSLLHVLFIIHPKNRITLCHRCMSIVVALLNLGKGCIKKPGEILERIKAAYSVTMNIFSKKNIFFLNHL